MRGIAKSVVILALVFAMLGFTNYRLEEKIASLELASIELRMDPTVIVKEMDFERAVANSVKASTCRLVAESARGGWTGSGVLVAPNIVLTAGHCVDGATNIRLEFYDGLEVEGKSWGSDGINDVGVIVLSESVDLPVIGLRQSPVELGEKVILIGSPFGVPNIVGWGRVSNPSVDIGDWAGNQFIVDAWTAPGNSGCAVFDSRGKLIGLLVGGFGSEAGHDSVCIPIDVVIDSVVGATNGQLREREKNLGWHAAF